MRLPEIRIFLLNFLFGLLSILINTFFIIFLEVQFHQIVPDWLYTVIGLILIYITPKWFIKSKGYKNQDNPYFPFQTESVTSIFLYLIFTLLGYFMLAWFGARFLMSAF
jgi:hypothetical protein